jgi:Acyl carrier protein phosphodiesterase
MNILHLDSSLFNEGSVSRKLGAQLVQRLKALYPHTQVVHRDLAANPPAHLSAELLLAAGKPEAERTEYEREQLALTQQLLDELFAADFLVIGAPMYNFSIPSQLKAWIDRVAQAGKTFRYTADGPEGLVKGKKAYIISSRGGVYSEGPAAHMEHQESYLLAVLGFIGVTDVQIIRAEGVALGEEVKHKALRGAEAKIEQAGTRAAA